MAVSETAGKTYDSAELKRLDDFLNQQQAQMELIDNQKEFKNKKVVQYALILTGAVISLILFKVLVDKKK
jgi:hypothetical protein